jgi:hypothetical protein
LARASSSSSPSSTQSSSSSSTWRDRPGRRDRASRRGCRGMEASAASSLLGLLLLAAFLFFIVSVSWHDARQEQEQQQQQQQPSYHGTPYLLHFLSLTIHLSLRRIALRKWGESCSGRPRWRTTHRPSSGRNREPTTPAAACPKSFVRGTAPTKRVTGTTTQRCA